MGLGMWLTPFNNAVSQPKVTTQEPSVPRLYLPMLPAPASAQRAGRNANAKPRGAGLPAKSSGGADIFKIAVNSLKQAIGFISRSLTALGNQANLLFGQVAATLAFDRMARQLAAFFGLANPKTGAWLLPQGALSAHFDVSCWFTGFNPFLAAHSYSPAALSPWLDPRFNPFATLLGAYSLPAWRSPALIPAPAQPKPSEPLDAMMKAWTGLFLPFLPRL